MYFFCLGGAGHTGDEGMRWGSSGDEELLILGWGVPHLIWDEGCLIWDEGGLIWDEGGLIWVRFLCKNTGFLKGLNMRVPSYGMRVGSYGMRVWVVWDGLHQVMRWGS